MTDLHRPLGLRFHLRSAAAACEGRALFNEKQSPQQEHDRRDARIWNALAALFNEAAEVVGEGHEDVLDRAILAAADALLEYTAPTRHAPLTDEPCGAHITPAGRDAVLDYHAIRRQQHPRGGEGT